MKDAHIDLLDDLHFKLDRLFEESLKGIEIIKSTPFKKSTNGVALPPEYKYTTVLDFSDEHRGSETFLFGYADDISFILSYDPEYDTQPLPDSEGRENAINPTKGFRRRVDAWNELLRFVIPFPSEDISFQPPTSIRFNPAMNEAAWNTLMEIVMYNPEMVGHEWYMDDDPVTYDLLKDMAFNRAPFTEKWLNT